MAKQSPSLMSGVPELVTLRLLKSREMYGYELARAIGEATRQGIVLGEGVLYSALHVMESRGFLKTRRVSVGGRTRVYYSLTHKGQKRFAQLMKEWRRISDGVESVLVGA